MGEGYKTAGFVAKTVGCVRATALNYLRALEKESLVTSLEVDNGQMNVWKKIQN